MLMPLAFLLIAADKPPPLSGELVLNATNPVVDVEIAGVKLRLRVDLDGQDSIELNPAAAASLPVPWEPGYPMDVGRVRLESRLAPVILKIYGRTRPNQVTEHGRDCCIGVDGAIGPDLLPYASVRWRRTDAPAATGTLSLPVSVSPMTGLSAPAAEIPEMSLRFALGQAETVGTAAAGAVLSRLWGGRWNDAPHRVTLAFGVSRPARTIGFTRPGLLAGFRFDTLLVRISDFAGDETLPADPVHPDEVVVTQHLQRQHAWTAVIIGADRLSRCADISFDAVARTLTLRCAFDQP